MLARFKRTEIMTRSVFQYIKSRQVRRRIYQVYVAPVIEWYLPVIMLKAKTAGSKLNAIESFQHKMMCLQGSIGRLYKSGCGGTGRTNGGNAGANETWQVSKQAGA